MGTLVPSSVQVKSYKLDKKNYIFRKGYAFLRRGKYKMRLGKPLFVYASLKYVNAQDYSAYYDESTYDYSISGYGDDYGDGNQYYYGGEYDGYSDMGGNDMYYYDEEGDYDYAEQDTSDVYDQPSYGDEYVLDSDNYDQPAICEGDAEVGVVDPNSFNDYGDDYKYKSDVDYTNVVTFHHTKTSAGIEDEEEEDEFEDDDGVDIDLEDNDRTIGDVMDADELNMIDIDDDMADPSKPMDLTFTGETSSFEEYVNQMDEITTHEIVEDDIEGNKAFFNDKEKTIGGIMYIETRNDHTGEVFNPDEGGLDCMEPDAMENELCVFKRARKRRRKKKNSKTTQKFPQGWKS